MTIRIRRRSAAIGLSALTLSGGLAACGGDDAKDTPMKVYASAEACQQSGQDWNTCNTSYQQAQSEQLRTAPRYKTREECLKETDGDCAETPGSSGGSMFMPLMTGFMLGQMMNGGSRYVSHPLYAGRDGGYYSGAVRVDPRRDDRAQSGGGVFGRSRALPSEVSAPMGADGHISSSRGVSRGGFGRAFGGGHGGGE